MLFYVEQMKRKNQYIFTVIMLIFTALLLFGCGKKARKLTEEEVKNLFKNHVIENYQECNFTDYTVEVTRFDRRRCQKLHIKGLLLHK